MAIARQLPGWIKGPGWLLAFLAGFWAFFALVRESRLAADFLVPRLEHGWRRLGEWSRRRERTWKAVILVCALAIAGVAIYRAWPVWKFMATTSLREDEIVNIARYTSRGFVPSISTYKLARDHIFYNILSTALPGADSTVPLRARLISFLSVSGALVLLVAYAGSRGWILAGVACAGLVAVNSFTLGVVLEARGYGFIFLCATCGCIAFVEWVRTAQPGLVAGFGGFVCFGDLYAAFLYCFRRRSFASGLFLPSFKGDVPRRISCVGRHRDVVPSDRWRCFRGLQRL